MTPQARPARKADGRELGRTLGRAFFDDPVTMWVMPDADARRKQMGRVFASMTRHHHLPRGGVEVASDGPGIGAAALWDPPNQWKVSRWAGLAQLPTFLWAFGPRSNRGRKLLEIMKRVHPEEPHWYLAVLGSDPSVRGQGFGQVLMRSRLERCDAEHCPAYLESSKPENVPYYQRFGFRVTGEITIPDGGPTLWPMWRDPQ